MSYLPIPVGRFFGLLKFSEIIAIKSSTDPMAQLLWQMWQIALGTGAPINLGSPEVQGAFAYLAATNQTPVPGYAPAWTAGTLYQPDATVSVGTYVYTMTAPTAETSAVSPATGPSGTGSAITDGSCVWAYTPTPYLAAGRVVQINALQQQ